MTDEPLIPSPDEIERIEDEASDLEERAERNHILPDDQAKGDGVGPQTGVVP
ncbi:MAG: hypothetical protein LCH57_04240 [Proteobacteria bacterium]|nr:hypothetical protein [Pseudomonadota bacterium]